MAKGYGMTEVSSAATAAAASITKPGSAGIPLVDTIVSVFEPGTAKELPIGEQGEICICSESIMKGYYHKPEETAAVKQVHPGCTPGTWAISTRMALCSWAPGSSG